MPFRILSTFILLCIVGIMSSEIQARVEIIDGGDVETMKALYPNADPEVLKQLGRMRQQRLQYEAQCIPNQRERLLSLVFSEAFTSAELAQDAIESRKQRVRDALASVQLKVTREYAEHESVMHRPARKYIPERYEALYNLNYKVVFDAERIDQLKEILKDSYIDVRVDKIKDCPEGHFIFDR